MFFSKYQAVFRSRWRALWWAGGVLLTAYCTVPSANQTDNSGAQADGKALASLFGEHASHQARHVNPWALPKDSQQH